MSRVSVPGWRRAIAAVGLAVVVPVLASCSGPAAGEVPKCGEVERVALIAQSVPSTSYVPCITALQPGWSSTGIQAQDSRTRFTLNSDRSPNHPVQVELSGACTVGTATPIAPRTPGGRSYLSLSSIDPRYAGTMYDVFPGGCVSYRFDFERGAHIPLMAQLQSIVGFVPRQQLRLDVQRQLGVRLDP